MPHQTDLDLTGPDIAQLTSADALAGFLTGLGYDTGARAMLTPEAIGLPAGAVGPIRHIELLSEDAEGLFLRVVFVQLGSLTAKTRNDLARVLGRTNIDHLLVLASDFEILEFVLLDKQKGQRRGVAAAPRVQVVPRTFAVDRRAPDRLQMRALRRLTWTCRDGLEQYEKLRTVFEAAAFTEEHFQNRALFADHYLKVRLPEQPAWQQNPSEIFHNVKPLLHDAHHRLFGKGEQVACDQLYEPIFRLLGFQPKVNKSAASHQTQPDYLLSNGTGKPVTAAFVYAWGRWLDGPDFNDQITPEEDPGACEENPGACVVSALDEGKYEWIVVTNGRLWRLYSRRAHSRATNFYEVDLVEALVASGDTDPNVAFRYWWLFFRSQAFEPAEAAAGCWLDEVVQGSRDYAKRLGEALKTRVFVTIFPRLAEGFLLDRRKRLGVTTRLSEEELADIFEATLTLLYRLLFLLYAESRDLLPIREAPYHQASLKKIKEQIAERAGGAESESTERIRRAYAENQYDLYDRLSKLFVAMDHGDTALNVPIYNGGLFITSPEDSDRREQRIARFLLEHRIPDRCLALAIDRLARDRDEKTYSLVFIDYKSLEVRHLGSIYEGLLEFKLKIAEEELTTQTEKKKEKYIPLAKAKPRRGRTAEVVVRKGEVYLSNDKAERKATGSYYTPDPIVEYIVEHTVGPVLDEKLEALRPKFRQVRRTFNREREKATAYPVKRPSGEAWDAREFALEKVYAEHKDLFEELFEFRTLDPAMGSGHFLVEAVDFITDRVLSFLNQFPVNPVSVALDRTRRNILAALGEQGVSVDAAKLTEVNLLKRHVLKRCIYGVDINPMAVELAKVSLWLDAFTLGAPLSFLDHHLRCGNSLIGATFEDLEKATKYQLFGIDYGPLMRAIHHVLFVNKMADATAAEVKQSAGEYAAARRDLSGYQIVADLLVARHFGYPNAPGLLELGRELDLSSRERFLASLEAAAPTKKGERPALEVVRQVTDLARRADLRFFHWEIEFPEVFFGFKDANQRQIEHKDKIAEGTAGFDAVVGNPPYVRIQTIDKGSVEYLRDHFAWARGKFDLYLPFLEIALARLVRAGRAGLIVPNKFLTADYGTGIRSSLARAKCVVGIVDFHDQEVFPGISTYCCLVFLAGRPYKVTSVCKADPMTLSIEVTREIPSDQLREAAWSTSESAAVVLGSGLPRLNEVCSAIFQGLITGGDPILIGRWRDERVSFGEEEFAYEEGIVRPLSKGKHIRRYGPLSRDTCVIYPYEEVDGRTVLLRELDLKKRYPETYAYLRRHKAELANRGSDSMEYESWYAHWCPRSIEKFTSPKILTQVLASRAAFTVDLRGEFFFVGGGNAGVYGLVLAEGVTIDVWYLLGVLNSRCFEEMVQASSSRFRGGFYSYARRFIQKVPIPLFEFSDAQRAVVQRVSQLAKGLCGASNNLNSDEVEAEIDSLVQSLYERR